MRRTMPVVALAAALLMAGLPAATLAAPPVRMSDSQTIVECELTSEAGTTFVFVAVSEEFGEFAGLVFWPDGTSPAEDDPAWISDTFSVQLSPDGTQLDASMDLFEYDPTTEPFFGAPVGTATLDATLTLAGPAEDFDESFRDGNRRVRISTSVQPLAAVGTLDLPEDISYTDLTGCAASEVTNSIFETNPNAFVFTSDQIAISCSWEGEDSFVGLFAVTDEFGTFSDIFVSDASGTYFGFSDVATLTTTAFSTSMALTSELTGEVEGSASASATLTPGERINFMDRFDGEKFKVIGQQLLVDGELNVETPAGPQVLAMNDETCFAQDAKVRSISKAPKPAKGPPLANDGPDGALPLAIGDAIAVRTGGTDGAPEEPCIVTVPEEGEFELPFGHTAWYTIEGTGGPVTIDTAGSDFDTALAVYTSDGASFTQVECVDDVFEEPDFFSLQARVTVDTTAGVTYYVQVGGFGGAAGRLQLSVN